MSSPHACGCPCGHLQSPGTQTFTRVVCFAGGPLQEGARRVAIQKHEVLGPLQGYLTSKRAYQRSTSLQTSCPPADFPGGPAAWKLSNDAYSVHLRHKVDIKEGQEVSMTGLAKALRLSGLSADCAVSL